MPEINAIEFQNVTKVFGTIVANNAISFSVQKGTIRALIGENGAGKSTAMKILFGLYKQDSGEILVHGKAQQWSSPRDAIKNAIGMVHQHFMLASRATGLDNILLGDEKDTLKLPFIPIPFNIIDRKKARLKIQALAKKYGLEVPLDTKIFKLSVGMQQRIEILKLLYRNADILILDEPTAVLTPKEVDELFLNLKRLKNEGKTIIIVTHKLREVLNFSDDITIFRGGRIVGNIKTTEATEDKIANLMVGRNVNLRPKISPSSHVGQSVLDIQSVHVNISKIKNSKKLLSNINFSIKSGEIVGIAGVEGNGQSEILNLIFHPSEYFGRKNTRSSKAFGKVYLFNQDITYKKSSQMSHLVVGFVPEDRHHSALLLNMSAEENYLLGRHREKRFIIGWFLHRMKYIQKLVKFEMKKYDVRPQNPKLHVDSFSGGNQQKLIIAREFGKNSRFLVAANPTRGVDIGSIEFIHKQIVEARDKNVGILLISSELDEIMTLSDRILVLYGGAIVAEFKRGKAEQYEIGLAMCGGLKNENY